MTDEALSAFERHLAEGSRFEVQQVETAFLKDLVAEVRRLRGLIKSAEVSRMSGYCLWCEGIRDVPLVSQTPHDVDCPAFLPSGEVR